MSDTTPGEDRRIWALYKLQWGVRKIAVEMQLPVDTVDAAVKRIRQDRPYQHKLENDPPPPGWEMFPADTTEPFAWPSLDGLSEQVPAYAGRHAGAELELTAPGYKPRHAAPRRRKWRRG